MSVSNIFNKSNLIPSTLLSTSNNLSAGNLITQIAVSGLPTSKITASAPDVNGVVTLGPVFVAPATGQFASNLSTDITNQNVETQINFTSVNYVTPGGFTPSTPGNYTDITVVDAGIYKVSYTLVANTSKANSQGYAYLKVKNGTGVPLSATAFQIYETNDTGGNITYSESVTHTFLTSIAANTTFNFVVVNNPALEPALSEINVYADTSATSSAVVLTFQLVDYTAST